MRRPIFPSTGTAPAPVPRLDATRLRDLLLAALALTLLAPLLLALALAIRLTAGGPALYRGARVGQGGQVFTLYKLRTLGPDAEAQIGARLVRPDEARQTPLGPTLRRLRLDELPQLFNVLRGHMALVGPRPTRPIFLAEHRQHIAGYDRRHTARPGLTGLAQVRGHYYTAPRHKLRYEMVYLRNRSQALDLWILAATLWHVFTGRRPRPPRARRSVNPSAPRGR